MINLCLMVYPASAASSADLERLLADSEESLLQQDFLTASVRFREALSIAQQGGDRRGEAAARNGIGRALGANRWEALAHLRLALVIHQELSDLRGQALDLSSMGEIYQTHGFSTKALPPLEEALKIQCRLGLAAEEAVTLESLGMAKAALGLYEEADAHLSAALEWRRHDKPDSFGQVRLAVRLGTLATKTGQDEYAVGYLEEALATVRRFRVQLPEEVWSSIVDKRAGLGMRLLQEIGPVIKGTIEKISRRGFKTNTDWELGDEMIQILVEEQALDLPEELMKRDQVREVSDSLSVGQGNDQNIFENGIPTMEEIMLMMSQSLAESFKLREQTIKEIHKDIKPEKLRVANIIFAAKPCEVQIANALREIYRLFERDQLAAEMNELAWSLVADQEALFSRLLSAVDAGDTSAVRLERQQAKALGLPVPPVFTDACEGILSRADDKLWYGDLAAAQGRIADALVKYREVSTEQTDPEMRVAALARMASLLEKSGDKARAVEIYRQAIDVIEGVQGSIRLEPLVASWASRQAPVYAEIIGLLYDLDQLELGFDFAERARAQAFLNQIGNQRLPAAAAPPDLAAELYAVRQKLIEIETFHKRRSPETEMPGVVDQEAADRLREEERTRRRYEELLGRLAQANPEYLSLVRVDTVGLAQTQREILPVDTSLVEYFVLDGRTLAWVIDRDTAQWIALPVSGQELHDKVEYFRRLIGQREPAAQAESARLYDTLIAPLAPFIRYDRLIIVPHGVLHYLPFNALWNSSLEHYLIDDYTVTLSPSVSALRFMLKRHIPKASSILAFGNPDGSLPQAEEEVSAVAAIYGSPFWLRNAAQESRVHQQAARADILHIAAHARYDSQRPLFTYIELAAEETRSTQDQRADGRLHLYEVKDLDLRATQMVVLSACDTALGPRDEGDEIVGLSRAFLAAGAASVITTLWQINDEASAALMKSFYRRLRAGAGASQALREAQIEMQRKDLWSDPYYWAGFTVTGDAGGVFLPSRR